MSTKMTPVLVITEILTPQRVFSNSAEIELGPRPNQIGTERKKPLVRCQVRNPSRGVYREIIYYF